MQEFGTHGWELLILWLGEIDEATGIGHVREAFVPDQEPITSEDGVGYFVRGNTLFELNKALSVSGLRLIAQVHSHPREAFHSEADDRYAIVTAEGGLSLVVPNFGASGDSPTDWAIYRLTSRAWIQLPADEVELLFEVT